MQNVKCPMKIVLLVFKESLFLMRTLPNKILT